MAVTVILKIPRCGRLREFNIDRGGYTGVRARRHVLGVVAKNFQDVVEITEMRVRRIESAAPERYLLSLDGTLV